MKKKESFLFASLLYHEIINFYKVVIIIHDANINRSDAERSLKLDYINYKKNWYYIFEKTKFMQLRQAFDFFRTLDKDNLNYKKYDFMIKPKLAEILKYWWFNKNKTRAHWNIFLARLTAYYKRLYHLGKLK
jgi:hypothetical protein